jgi:hypothetical protein
MPSPLNTNRGLAFSLAAFIAVYMVLAVCFILLR